MKTRRALEELSKKKRSKLKQKSKSSLLSIFCGEKHCVSLAALHFRILKSIASMMLFILCAVFCILLPQTQAFAVPSATRRTPDHKSRRTFGQCGHQRQHDMALPMADGLTSCWANEQGSELIQRFGSIFEPECEKLHALENLVLSPSQELILDSALEEIEKAKNSRLASKRLPIRLPSRRATAGCFGRILAEVNAGRLSGNNAFVEIGQTKVASSDDTNQQRVNLFFLLRTLSTYGKGVWSLEGSLIETTGIQDFGMLYGEAFQ